MTHVLENKQKKTLTHANPSMGVAYRLKNNTLTFSQNLEWNLLK